MEKISTAVSSYSFFQVQFDTSLAIFDHFYIILWDKLELLPRLLAVEQKTRFCQAHSSLLMLDCYCTTPKSIGSQANTSVACSRTNFCSEQDSPPSRSAEIAKPRLGMTLKVLLCSTTPSSSDLLSVSTISHSLKGRRCRKKAIFWPWGWQSLFLQCWPPWVKPSCCRDLLSKEHTLNNGSYPCSPYDKYSLREFFISLQNFIIDSQWKSIFFDQNLQRLDSWLPSTYSGLREKDQGRENL